MELAKSLAPLGFGFMRLPEFEDEAGNKVIDLETVNAMVDEFMDAGFNYFDTAWTYHGGRSEVALRQALVERYPRDSFQIATKMPAWAANSTEEAHAMFDTSLKRTGAGYFDYYLLHQLGGDGTVLFDEYGLWDFALAKRDAGLIKHFGFSFHGTAEELQEILSLHAQDVEFVQLQINYTDWENEIIQSRKCYEIVRAYDLPVIVMEPVKGGSLVKLPPTAEAILKAADPHQSLASWALRFPASLEGVKVVLSGMSTPEQLHENVHILADGKPLSEQELAAIEAVCTELSLIDSVPCTHCGYCLKGCPQHIHIPIIMDSLDILAKFDDMYRAQENYNWNAPNEASTCIECGNCERRCPQHIDIICQLKRAAELFE